LAAFARATPCTHGKSQFSPLPSKIARYVASGFAPLASTTRPPTTNASAVVSTAPATPPARCRNASRAATVGALPTSSSRSGPTYCFWYGFPSAAGGTVRPITPATAISVSTYGRTLKSVAADAEGGAECARRTPVPEDQRCERDEAAAVRHVVAERRAARREAVRQIDAAERGENAGHDDARVAHGVHVDPDGVGGARMLAARADAQPDRRLEDDDVRDDHEHEARPDHDVEVPDRRTEEVAVPQARDGHVRDGRDAGRDVVPVVELEEEVPGDAEREEVHRRPADDLVGA